MDNNQKNKKGFFSISKGLIFILLGIIFVFVLIYVLRFHRVLSSEHLTWSQFGDIFNGVISPIFAGINICIFWYLTKVVDLNNDERQEEIQSKERELQEEIQRNEDRRRNQDAEHQKAMILMQFRKAEIDKLEEVLQNVLAPTEGVGKSPYYRAGVAAVTYILNFVNSKLGLFNLGPNDETTKLFFSLHDRIEAYCEELLKVGSDAEKLSNNVLEEFLTLKCFIISDLQKITLGEKIS